MDWVILYLFFAVLAFLKLYADAVRLNYRMPPSSYLMENSWTSRIADSKAVLRLLHTDFLRIHCPWSWDTAVYYRTREAYRLLQTSTHEKGWTTIDCFYPAKRPQIARDCFCSRTRFWAEGGLRLITSPIILTLSLVISFVLVPILLKFVYK